MKIYRTERALADHRLEKPRTIQEVYVLVLRSALERRTGEFAVDMLGLSSNSSFSKWISLSAVLGFIAFIVYLWFFSDIGDVAGVLERTNLYVYGLAFICVLAGVAFDSLTWKQLLKNNGADVGFRKLFSLSWVGSFVDALIPGGWSGDIFKTYVLIKESNVAGPKAAASIVVKNVIESLITMSFLIVGIVLLALNYPVEIGILLAVGTTMVLLTLPLIIVVYVSMSVHASEKLFRWFKWTTARVKGQKGDASSGFEDKIRSSLNEFHEGIVSIKTRPRSIVKPLIFQIGAWVFDLLALTLIFASLGRFIGFDKILITNTIVNSIQSQGVALAGFAQMISSTIYTVLGISAVLSIASSLLAGFASFWFKIIIAFFAFQYTISSHCIPGISRRCESILGKKSCEDPRLSRIEKQQSDDILKGLGKHALACVERQRSF